MDKVTPTEVNGACEQLRHFGIDPMTATRGDIRRVCGVGDRRARTIRDWILRSTSKEVHVTPKKEKASFDSAYKAYCSMIGQTVAVGVPESTKTTPTEKIVVAGDFHVPFNHKVALQTLIEEESGDTDLLIISGDLGDFWATSRFPKSKRLVSPVEELAETQAVLSLLASKFKRIKLLGGNHDDRPQKYLANLLPPEILDYIALTGPMVFKPLEFMSAGLLNVEVVPSVPSEGADFGFFYQYGDLLCTHAEKFSTVPGKTATDVLKWVKAFAEPQQLVNGIRCVVQAHSHLGGTVIADYGCLAVDGGCMSKLQDYHGTPKIMTPRPLAQGWTVVYQNNGVTDQRDTRFKPLKH